MRKRTLCRSTISPATRGSLTGHRLEGGARRAVRSSSAGRQRLAHRRPLAPRISGGARAVPERQVQGPSRREHGRVQPARLTFELQPGCPCIMMQATATLSLELFMRARRPCQSTGLRQEVPAFSFDPPPSSGGGVVFSSDGDVCGTTEDTWTVPSFGASEAGAGSNEVDAISEEGLAACS
jgi:hypothetical protein